MSWLIYLVLLNISLPCMTSKIIPEIEKDKTVFMSNFLNKVSPSKRVVAFLCKERSSAISILKHLGVHFQVTYINISPDILFNPYTILESKRVTILYDLGCKGCQTILERAKQSGLFRKGNSWLFIGDVSQISEKIFLSKHSNSHIFTTKGGNINVNKIYKKTEFSRSFSLELICTWSMLDRKSICFEQNCTKVINFMKEPIRVSYAFMHKRTVNHLTDYRFPQQDQQSKITYLLINHICDLFNATHSPTIRSYWGYYNRSSGSFTPLTMFSDVFNGLVDISGNTAGTTNDRLKYFRFLAPTGHMNLNSLKWFFRAPPLSYTQNIWILPFADLLWFVILAVIVVWYLAIMLIAAYEFCVLKRDRMNERNCWFVALDVVLTTVTLRGSHITFSTISGKLICYCIFLLVVLLNIAYSANFLVLLQSTAKGIRNFDDLLKSNMHLGSPNESYIVYYFMTIPKLMDLCKSMNVIMAIELLDLVRFSVNILISSVVDLAMAFNIFSRNPNDLVDESVRLKISSFILSKKNKFWVNVSEGIQMVKNGVFAYHVASTIGYDEIARTYDEATKRSIQTINSVIQLNNYLCVLKNSSLEDFLNYGFIYLHETGILRREQNRMFPHKPTPDYSKTIFASLDINDVAFLFWNLLAGITDNGYALLDKAALTRTTILLISPLLLYIIAQKLKKTGFHQYRFKILSISCCILNIISIENIFKFSQDRMVRFYEIKR